VTSRLRQPRARCRLTRGPAVPRRVMSCGDGSALVLWAAQSTPDFVEPRASLLPLPRCWDLDAPERAHIAAELAAWPMPRAWTRPPVPASRRYWYRSNVDPPPMRQRGVVGDLAAGAAEIRDRKSKVRAT